MTDGRSFPKSRPMVGLETCAVPGWAPEDMLVHPDGRVFTGLRDEGTLIEMDPNKGSAEVLARPGEQPLGLEWMPDGRMLICNAALGLQVFDLATGTVEALEIKGTRINVCNNAAVMADGTIFVSDSTTAYPLMQFRNDIIEDTRSGRLLRIDPDGTATIMLDGLTFANGVALTADAVLVAETAKARIHRVPLKGGTPHIFADVPGLPDNLSTDEEGLVWAAFPSLPNPALGTLHKLPMWARRLASRVPEKLQPNAPLGCRVAAYTGEGELVHLFDGDPGIFNHVTGVRRHGDRVYLSSIEQGKVAWFDLKASLLA